MKRLFLVLVLGGVMGCGIAWMAKRSAAHWGLGISRSESQERKTSRLLPSPGVPSATVGNRVADSLDVVDGTTFVVSDLVEIPIEGANLVLREDWRSIGSTDSTGSLGGAHGLEAGVALLIRAPGYVPQTICLTGAEPRVVEVRLERAWTLSGRVVDPSGLTIGEGLNVLALKPKSFFSAGWLGSSLSGMGPIPVAKTNAAGEFEFDELDVNLGYRLYAGGQGFCVADSFGEFVGPEASQAPIVLTVYPVYGTHIRLREPGGALLRLSEDVGGGWWGGGINALVADAKIVFSGEWTAVMLGVEPFSKTTSSRFDRTDYFITHEDYGEEIDVGFDPNFPGYIPGHYRLNANRVRSGVVIHSLELTPEGVGFGSLSIWFDPTEGLERMIPVGTSPDCGMYLTLSDASGGGQEIKVSLPGIERGFCEIAGIPFGTYFAQFHAPHQLFRYPKHEEGIRLVTIGDMAASFRVPLAHLGALDLRIMKADGSPYVGPISGTHVRRVGKETDAFFFATPPYVIPLLPKGDYSLSVWIGATNLNAGFAISTTEITVLELHAGG